MPPIRSGSTERVASTWRPEAFAIWSTICARLLVGELLRGRQLDRELALLARRRAARARSRSPRPRAMRPFSARRRRKLRTSVVGAVGDRLERRGLRARVDLRVAQQLRAAPARRARPRRSRRAPPGPRRRSPAPWRPRRAPARRCGATTATAATPSPARARRSRARRSPRRSAGGDPSSSSTLPVTFVGRLERQVGDLGADLLDRALRLGLDLACRVSSSAPRRSASISSSGASRCASADLPRLGEDLLGLGCGPARSARGAPRAACGPRRGRGRPPRSTARICSRRSSIVFWIGRTRTSSARRT